MRELARSGAWAALDNGSAAAFSFLFFVVTARLLSPEDFGVAALALSVAQILQPLIESLFHDAVVQRELLADEDITTTTTACIAWSLALAGGLWAIAPGIGAALSAPALATYLPPLGLALVFSALSAVAGAVARRQMQFRLLAIRTIVGRVVGMGVGIALAWFGYGVWSIIVQVISTAAISSLLLVGSIGIKVGRVRWTRLKPFVVFGAPTVGTQFLLYANSRVMTVLMGAALGPVAAGTWNVALRFVEPLQALLATTIGQIALPLLARQQSDAGAIAGYFLTGTRLITVVIGPMFLGLAVCSHLTITVFVGEKWLNAAPLMQIVCIVTLFILLRQLAEIALTARGRPHYTFYTHAVGSGLSLLGATIGVTWGLHAAAIGWSARALPFLTLNAVFVRRELGIAPRDQVAAALRPILASIGMAAIVASVQALLAGLASPVPRLLALISAGAFVYAALLVAIDPEARRLLRGRLVPLG